MLTTKQIREKIWHRQDKKCLWCDKELTWKQAHMHEVVPRGRGGKISLENSIILCYDCHLNNAHGDRRPQWRRNARPANDESQ